MSNDSRKTYEAMFVMEGSAADFEAATEPIRRALGRSQAEIIALKPWDERRLAYEIKGRRRGLYALAYFTAEAGKIVEIEHDCQLSDDILRVLILHREKLTEEEINADTPMRPTRPAEAGKEDAAKVVPDEGKPEAPKPSTEEEQKEDVLESEETEEVDSDEEADNEDTRDGDDDQDE
jgi:small subunit ribosomal protein S6